MGAVTCARGAGGGEAARFTCRFFDRFTTDQLGMIRQNLDAVIDDRSRQYELFGPPPPPAPEPPRIIEIAAPKAPAAAPAPAEDSELAACLSPTQVTTYLECAARWYFRYFRGLVEPRTSSLALGSAVDAALRIYFEQRIRGNELEPDALAEIYGEAWRAECEQTEFAADEQPAELGRLGESLVRLALREWAPAIEPAAAQKHLVGVIGGVRVQGYADLVDARGKIYDLKVKKAKRAPTAGEVLRELSARVRKAVRPGYFREKSLARIRRTEVRPT